MKIAIVVGHNERSQGAVRVTDRESEYKWNGDLAKRIEKLDPKSVKVFYRTPGNNEISRVYQEVARWGAECAVELHFNAFSSASAHGCETLYGRSDQSKKLAQYLQDEILNTLGNYDRGLLRRVSGRGSLTVNQTAQPTALIEPYFGSNPSECKISEQLKDELALAILNGARNFLGEEDVVVGPIEDTSEEDRIKNVLEEIGDLAASALATGWSPDLPLNVQRDRWTLASIFNMTKQETE